MKKVSAMVLIGGALLSFNASAEEARGYFGVGYHLGLYDEDQISDFTPTGLKFKIGKYLNKSVAVEANFVFGVEEDRQEILGFDFDLGIKNSLSLFVKGDIDINDSALFYGLLGFSKGKLEFDVPDVGVSGADSDSGLSYGFGIEVGVGSDLYLSGEYVLYMSKDDYDYSAFNFGMSVLF